MKRDFQQFRFKGKTAMERGFFCPQETLFALRALVTGVVLRFNSRPSQKDMINF